MTTFVRVVSESSYLPLTESDQRTTESTWISFEIPLDDEEYDSFSGVFESTSVKFDRAHYCLRLEERKNSKKKNEKWTRNQRKVEKKSIIWLEIILNREFHQNSYFLLKLENSISVLFYLIAIYSYSSFLIYLYLVEKLWFRKWKIRINVISKNLPLENI